MFIRRYMSDRVHRLRTDDVAYCGKQATHGERMKRPTLIGRCERCEELFEKEQERKREAQRGL